MKSITEWFDEYSDSHQDQTNKKIHWVCVPAILFSIIGTLAHFSTLLTALLLVLTLVFYARLDIVLAVADCNSACRGRFLYWRFCGCLDWTVLWAQSRGQKAIILQGPAIPSDWPSMVHGRLSG